MGPMGSNEDNLRDFDFDRDLPAVKRIWREVGWIDDDHSEKQLDHFFAGGSTMVGTIDDIAECSVHTTPGTMRLQDEDLPLCAVTAVTAHSGRSSSCRRMVPGVVCTLHSAMSSMVPTIVDPPAKK